MVIFFHIFLKWALKGTIFFNLQKRPKNSPTILFLANSFKKGQLWLIWPFQRLNGNPGRRRRQPIILFGCLLVQDYWYRAKFSCCHSINLSFSQKTFAKWSTTIALHSTLCIRD